MVHKLKQSYTNDNEKRYEPVRYARTHRPLSFLLAGTGFVAIRSSEHPSALRALSAVSPLSPAPGAPSARSGLRGNREGGVWGDVII